MSKIIVRHKVGNFDTWLEGHKDRLEVFAPAISGFETYRAADDPNAVILVVEVTDLEKLGRILNDPANASLKEKHTVIEPIEVYAPVDV